MGTISTSERSPGQELTVLGRENRTSKRVAQPEPRAIARRVGRTSETVAKFEEEVMQRLEALLAEIRWEPKHLAEAVWEKMGYGGDDPKKSVTAWFDRRSINLLALRVVCEAIGVNPAYLLGMTNDLAASATPLGLLEQAIKFKTPAPEPRKSRPQAKRPSRPRRSA